MGLSANANAPVRAAARMEPVKNRTHAALTHANLHKVLFADAVAL